MTDSRTQVALVIKGQDINVSKDGGIIAGKAADIIYPGGSKRKDKT